LMLSMFSVRSRSHWIITTATLPNEEARNNA
jgi:hypothetical protein